MYILLGQITLEESLNFPTNPYGDNWVPSYNSSNVKYTVVNFVGPIKTQNNRCFVI